MIWLAVAHAGETVLLAPGATWKYLDTGVDPGPSWTDPGFDDGAWLEGPAPLGYGVLVLGTTVGYGPNALARYPTTWFRTEVDVPDPAAFEAFSTHLRRDDGVVIYVNGVEVARDNVAAGQTATSYATLGVFGLDQDTYFDQVIPASAFVAGTNTVAVELHNQTASSADLVVDLGISAWDGPTAVTRGPYLQQTGPEGTIVRWRTDGPGQGEVTWGAVTGNLTESAVDPELSFTHTVAITGMPPDSLVTYAVGHPASGVLVGDDLDHRFRTAPVPGTRTPLRVWLLGDSGTANVNAEVVRDAWRTLHPDPLETSVMWMLGDNAYTSGKDSEYQRAVFDFYPEWLRQVSLWATLGNHDGYSAYSDTQTGPYFDIFDFPKAGELGGEPSGTEAYWSFDYANVHFVNLDSYHSDRSPTGAMATWLEADLAASTGDWNIVVFHHPPYTKGSHNSDTEEELVEMREFLNPILEDHGVDLVFSGHSHSYERSYLLDGHYGDSTTFLPENRVQDGSGDPATDGAYTKWEVGTGVHDGTVYVVAGSSGQVSGGSLNHPAMVVSMSELGSVGLEIDGLDLTATFLDELAAVRDTFEIHKGVTTFTELSGDPIGIEGELLAFSAAATQPGGIPVVDFSWDWGDGTDSAGAEATHAWANEGDFLVVVTATDDGGQSTTRSLSVAIDNGVPSIDQASWTGVSLEGEVITFTAVGSDPGADPLTYTWTIDGERTYGSTVQHVFLEQGSYLAHLDLSDDAGRVVSTDLALTIGNAAPELSSFTADNVREGTPATLFAIGDDPGLDFVTIRWLLPDRDAVGTSVTYTFPDDGVYPVELELSDSDGAVTTVVRDVVVANLPPTVTVSRDGTGGVEGDSVILLAETTDPGLSDRVEVQWDFGDGEQATGARVEHRFPDDGPFDVTVTAADGDGGQASAVLAVELENLPPVIALVQVSTAVLEGREVAMQVLATDPGTLDTLEATWSLGDGRTATGLTTTARWLDEGTWDARVDVEDDDGGTASWPFVVTVENLAPVFTSVPPVTRVEPGGSFVYDVSFDDVDAVTLTVLEPAGASVDGARVTYRAPDAPGTSVGFRLRGDDGDGGVTEQVFSLALAGVSSAPGDRLDRGDPPARRGCDTGGRTGSGWLAVGVAWLASRCRRSNPRGRLGPTAVH